MGQSHRDVSSNIKAHVFWADDSNKYRHGRDNKLHVWSRVDESTFINVGGSASVPGLSVPTICYSMDVNALNFCRFSLLPLPARRVDSAGDDLDAPQSQEALIAVPNLVESSWVSLADVHGTFGELLELLQG